MANLFHYGGENDDAGYVFTTVSGAITTGNASPAGPRNGVGRWFRAVNGQVLNRVIPASSHVFVGAAAWSGVLDTTNVRPGITLYGDAGVTAHLTVAIASTYVQLKRGNLNGTLLATYNLPTALNVSTWLPYIEIEATIADVGGIAKVRLDGVEVISYSGDTKNGGTNTTIDMVSLVQNGTANVLWDDMYVNDDTGSANNSYAGPIVVRNLMPSGAGSSTQWTPDSGSNYAQVNDTTINTATGVQSTTSNDLDLYAMGDVPAGTTVVKAVSVNVVARNPDGGAASVKPVLRSGGTNYEGSAVALSSVEKTAQSIWDVDPATSAAWTVSGANAIEAGVKRV